MTNVNVVKKTKKIIGNGTFLVNTLQKLIEKYFLRWFEVWSNLLKEAVERITVFFVYLCPF